jgi:hypothetical protein
MMQFIQKDGLYNPIIKKWDDVLGFYFTKEELLKVLNGLENRFPDDKLTSEMLQFYARFDRIKMPEVSE